MVNATLYGTAFTTDNAVLVSVLNIINLVLAALVGLIFLVILVAAICAPLKRKSIRVLKQDLKYLGYEFEKDTWGRETPMLSSKAKKEQISPVNRLKAWCYYRSDITYLFRKPVDTTDFKQASHKNISLFRLGLQRSVGKEVAAALRKQKNQPKAANVDAGIPFAAFAFVGEIDLERILFFQKNAYVLAEVIKLGGTPLEQLAPFDGVPPSMVVKVFSEKV